MCIKHHLENMFCPMFQHLKNSMYKKSFRESQLLKVVFASCTVWMSQYFENAFSLGRFNGKDLIPDIDYKED